MNDKKTDQQSRIRVIVRKRPLNKKEAAKGQQDIVQVKDQVQVILSQMKLKVDLTKYIEEHQFCFDQAYDETVNNHQLYNYSVKPMVISAFQGAKVTCFAYGQTGSGKTYTMNGDLQKGCPGMYYLGGEDIFGIRDQNFPDLKIIVSFYQIYCGKLFDLLNNREQLQARQDAKQNVNIIGLTLKNVENIEDFLKTIAYGSSVRITSQNSTNSDSSRSHAILQISLMNSKKLHGKISFIDLAGCQRGADTMQQNKQTKIDGAQINKSLLALKQCIRALDQGKNHTPFRGSKLTMVLKDSFTGFCRTLMIGNISPSSGSCQNTLNTLRYADRVKQLKKGNQSSQMNRQDRISRELMLARGKNTKILKCQSDNDQNDQQSTLSVKNKRLKAMTHSVQPQTKRNASKPFNNLVNRIATQNHEAQQLLKRCLDQRKNKPLQKPRKSPIYQQQSNSILQKQQKKRVNSQYNHHLNNRTSRSRQQKKQIISKHQDLQLQIQELQMKLSKSTLSNTHKIPSTKQNINIKPNNQYMRNYSEANFKRSTKVFQNFQSVKTVTVENIDPNVMNDWNKYYKMFQNWQPSPNEIEQMSEYFEKMVKIIMEQQLKVSELHNQLLQSEATSYNQSAALYTDMQRDSRSNQDMLKYASKMSSNLQQRIIMMDNLKCQVDQYRKHLKEYEICERKLIESGNMDFNDQDTEQGFWGDNQGLFN